MRNIKYGWAALLLSVFVVISAPAMALTLDQARSQGMVAEQLDGFVVAISASSDVVQLVADVNTRRKAEYARIAKENGQTPAVVGKLAAPKIIGGLPKGALYQADNGGWATR